MKITVNAEVLDTDLDTLDQLLDRLGHESKTVATAVNGEFVPLVQRKLCELNEGDAIEIIAPMAGG